MCTAVSYNAFNHYFGRNLDWDFSFGEEIIITPRNFKLNFTDEPQLNHHYSFMGVGIVKNNYPLYFDAVNEFGLCIAGLNFPSNAVYYPFQNDKTNITPYEFIPYILGKCKTVSEATEIIKNINFLNVPFSDELPLSPLHWIVSDKSQSITVEPLKSGTKIYINPVGVLTNNPQFNIQLHNLNNYINVTPNEPENNFSKYIDLKTYSRGMGSIGLPGDYSSQSRFVKAAFVKSNIISNNNTEDVGSFFHILSSVEMPKGCIIANNNLEHTIYSNCYETSKGVLHLKTYNNFNIKNICMHSYNLYEKELIIEKSDL